MNILLVVAHRTLGLESCLLKRRRSGDLNTFVSRSRANCSQVVRYYDLNCCSTYRSSIEHLLAERFLPNPVPTKHKWAMRALWGVTQNHMLSCHCLSICTVELPHPEGRDECLCHHSVWLALSLCPVTACWTVLFSVSYTMPRRRALWFTQRFNVDQVRQLWCFHNERLRNVQSK